MKARRKKIFNKRKALSLFNQGFSCSQAVFGALAPGLGLDRLKALRIASAYGGGICRRGELCGAVSGGLMAIGLKFGHTKAKDLAGKEAIYRIAQRFIKWFEKKYGTLICCELTGVDIGVDGKRRPRFHSEICRGIVQATEKYLNQLFRARKIK